VKSKTLTILTASFVLLISSFTFSSCKDCGKKEPEPAGRGGKTSTENDNKTKSSDNGNIPGNGNISDDNGKTPAGDDGSISGNDNKTKSSDNGNIPGNGNISDDNGKTPAGDDGSIPGNGNISNNPTPPPFSDTTEPKREITLLQQIQELVKEAAGYVLDAYDAMKATHDARDLNDLPKAQTEAANAATASGKLKDLTKRSIVTEAKNSGVENIAIYVRAIELLSVRMEREEKRAVYWLRTTENELAQGAQRVAGDAKKQAAKEACDRTQAAFATADAEDDNAGKAWDEAWSVAQQKAAESEALNIVRDAFVNVAKVKGNKGEGMSEEDANSAFGF
jgi:hypothetical protein